MSEQGAGAGVGTLTPPPHRPGPMIEWTEEDLAEGRALVLALDGSQWALGDLAIRVAGPAQNSRAHDGSVARLAVFADAIGMHHEQLGRYRSVATAWPPERRVPGASWTLHRTLAPLPEDDRYTLLVEFIAACELGGTRPTRDLLLTRLRTKPILPEEEPRVLPTLAECLGPLPTEITVPVPPRRTTVVEPYEQVTIEAPTWMSFELARIRMAGDAPESSETVVLTVNEAMAQFYELETRVAAMNEYRRVLLFAIASQRPKWWPVLEEKLEAMDTAEQWLMEGAPS